MDNPKLTIIMPVHNAGEYLRRSINSIQAQIMEDWELIIFDDGSTDDSIKIEEQYHDMDDRIRVITSSEVGYGKTMNRLLDECRGEFIGDVDPDDWIEPDMFAHMIESIGDCDFIQCGFIFELEDRHVPTIQNTTETFCPRLLPLEQRCNFFGLQPAIWSRVYRRSFIEDNHIRLHETPGASFQDTAFVFKCNCLANKVRIIDELLYHYERRNVNSSTLKKDAPFASSVEFRYMHEWLNEHLEYAERTRASLCRLQFGSYIWNYFRIADEDKLEFARRMREDFINIWEYLDIRMFESQDLRAYRIVCESPEDFVDLVKKEVQVEGKGIS